MRLFKNIFKNSAVFCYWFFLTSSEIQFEEENKFPFVFPSFLVFLCLAIFQNPFTTKIQSVIFHLIQIILILDRKHLLNLCFANKRLLVCHICEPILLSFLEGGKSRCVNFINISTLLFLESVMSSKVFVCVNSLYRNWQNAALKMLMLIYYGKLSFFTRDNKFQ